VFTLQLSAAASAPSHQVHWHYASVRCPWKVDHRPDYIGLVSTGSPVTKPGSSCAPGAGHGAPGHCRHPEIARASLARRRLAAAAKNVPARTCRQRKRRANARRFHGAGSRMDHGDPAGISLAQDPVAGRPVALRFMIRTPSTGARPDLSHHCAWPQLPPAVRSPPYRPCAPRSGEP